jgi:hypothetical protein
MTEEKPTTQKKVIKIDASYLSSNAGCDLATCYALFSGYKYPLPNISMQFGTAFHYFAAEMYRSVGNLAKASKEGLLLLQKPCEEDKKKLYLLDPHYYRGTCFEWWNWHQEKDAHEVMLLPDGKPAVEQNFSFPIHETDDCIIELAGTIDRLGKVRNGCYCVVDYKTTSTTNVQSYFHGFKMSVQLRTYVYAIAHYAKSSPASIFAAFNANPIGARIDGIFTRGASKPVEVLSSPVIIFKESDMIEYERLLMKKAKHLAELYKQWLSDPASILREGLVTGACFKKFGTCDYFDVCAANDDVCRAFVLEKNFIKREYNPLAFGKD